MTHDISRKTIALLLIFAALWLLCYLRSVSILIWTEPTGDGFTRGLNRIAGFLGWQFAAGAMAIVIYVMGRQFPKGGRRWLSRVPLIFAALPFAFVVAVLAWGWTQQLLHPPQTGTGPVTNPAATAPAATVTD